MLRPILKPARKPRYTLDELLSGMTRDNVPQEVDWGPQRGNEACEVAAYCPDTGDIIWLDFLQSVANEQAGRRSALVLSPRAFNELTGRCIACPITRA